MKKTNSQNKLMVWLQKAWHLIERIFEVIGLFFLNLSNRFQLSIAFKITFAFVFMYVLLSTILGPLMAPLGTILIAIFGFRAVKYFLQPVDELTAMAKQISTSDLSARLDVREAQDELRDLTITFNEMMARLENGMEEQKAFINHASHELRTPLSVIDGYSNLLDRWGKDDPLVRDEAIQAIKEETLSMRELVEKLLLISRMDHGTQFFDPKPFEVQELIREVISETQMIKPDTPTFTGNKEAVQLTADRLLIKDILRNLINNAIAYTPLDGEIRVLAEQNKNKVILSVRDTGCGISEAFLRTIFVPFSRVDSSRDRHTGGTGLGLSIVKRITELHHGQVRIASQVGQGTLIRIELPKETKIRDIKTES